MVGFVDRSEKQELGEDTEMPGCPQVKGIVPPLAPFHDGLPWHRSQSNGTTLLKSMNLCAQINLIYFKID